ncbi:MAG TPA: PIN domain-containing protein [Vicinamibacteria bacterium]|nr:PIN domain-containing protein [Vicinamibacteria bacterium]
MAALVDTNVLVYRFDPRFPARQRIARDLLRQGLVEDSLRIPHQALVEFVAVVVRPISGGPSLLTLAEAIQEVEDLCRQFTIVVYPNEGVLKTALRGAAAYQLSWFDAHLWAYAEHFGLDPLLSEDFQHDRAYGSVRAVNPFL